MSPKIEQEKVRVFW